MTQTQLDHSVASATGETLRTIHGLGFRLVTESPDDLEPENLQPGRRLPVLPPGRCRTPASPATARSPWGSAWPATSTSRSRPTRSTPRGRSTTARRSMSPDRAMRPTSVARLGRNPPCRAGHRVRPRMGAGTNAATTSPDDRAESIGIATRVGTPHRTQPRGHSDMITITRRQARRLRGLFRRSALGIGHRGPVPPLVFHAEADATAGAISVRGPGPRARRAGRVPVSRGDRAAARRPGRFRGPPRHTRRARGRRARPDHRPLGRPRHPAVPRRTSSRCSRLSPRSPSRPARGRRTLPTCSTRWPRRPRRPPTTAPATPWAASCSGAHASEVVATDGRQLLVQGGFRFPWTDDVLVRRSPLFASKEWPRDRPVAIGKTDTHVVLRVGPWTLYLEVQTGRPIPAGRPDHPRRLRPRPPGCGSTPRTPRSSVQALDRLPGAEEPNARPPWTATAGSPSGPGRRTRPP